MAKKAQIVAIIGAGVIAVLWPWSCRIAYREGRQSAQDVIDEYWTTETLNNIHRAIRILKLAKQHPGILSKDEIRSWRADIETGCVRMEERFIPYLRRIGHPQLLNIEKEVRKVREELRADPGAGNGAA